MLNKLLKTTLILFILQTSIAASTQGQLNLRAVSPATTKMELSATDLDFGEIGSVRVTRELDINISSNSPDGFSISISSENRGYFQLSPQSTNSYEKLPYRIKAELENSDRYDTVTFNGEESRMNRFVGVRNHPDITINASGTDLAPIANNTLNLKIKSLLRNLAVGNYSDTLTISIVEL